MLIHSHMLKKYLFGCIRSFLWPVGSSLPLQLTGSIAVVLGLSCCMEGGILIPSPGIKPMLSAFQGGFLTPEPPGKSLLNIFYRGLLVTERLLLNHTKRLGFLALRRRIPSGARDEA